MSLRVRPCNWLHYAGLTVLIGVLGLVDYWTGNELNFFLFYFVPVGLAAYYLGLRSSVAVSVICATIWALADVLDSNEYSHGFFAVWNTMIRLGAFITIGCAIFRIGALLATERNTAEQLREARAKLRILEGLLPICASCKKIRDATGTWEPLERYITDHSEATFSHGMCPACKQKFIDEVRNSSPSAAPP